MDPQAGEATERPGAHEAEPFCRRAGSRWSPSSRVGVGSVARLEGASDVRAGTWSRPCSTAQALEQFTPKRLTYELFGTVGNGGMLSYVDINGHPHKVDITELPWTHTETTTLTVGRPAASRRRSPVATSRCRMLVNDVVRDEQSSTHAEADVTCRVKSA